MTYPAINMISALMINLLDDNDDRTAHTFEDHNFVSVI